MNFLTNKKWYAIVGKEVVRNRGQTATGVIRVSMRLQVAAVVAHLLQLVQLPALR